MVTPSWALMRAVSAFSAGVEWVVGLPLASTRAPWGRIVPCAKPAIKNALERKAACGGQQE